MGNKLKHEVKTHTFHEIGMKLDDMLEASKRDQARMDGAKQALLHARNKVEELTKHVDKDVLDSLLDLEQASLVKKYIVRAVGVLSNLALQSEVQYHQTQGQVVALEKTVAMTKNLYDAERVKLEAALEEEASPPPEVSVEAPHAPREVGTHPGNRIADRKAADAAERAALELDSPEPVVEQSIVQVATDKKTRKKR